MARIIIQVRDAHLQTVLEALTPGWTAQVEDATGRMVDNPLPRAEAARLEIMRMIRARMRELRMEQARLTAQRALADAERAAWDESQGVELT